MTPESRTRLTELLKQHEDFRSHLYKDSRGYNTIGYGTNIDAGLSEKNAIALLESRIDEDACKLFYYHPFFNELNEARQIALLDMCYNLGIEGFLKFHNMISALQAHDYQRAHNEILNSQAAIECKDRYKQIATIILTGEL